MNPLFAEAQSTVQGMWVMGLMTALFLVFFIGWVLWAYHPGRKAWLEEAGRMPFHDEAGPRPINEGGES
ncbi:MAG: cbb3-type cytochrome c oxidase subunit 3 [Longimicrobiales bacterium]|nr:cbb3-type cytochrome c oxidase subunit 3 [Longimicrobiales bacterium]